MWVHIDDIIADQDTVNQLRSHGIDKLADQIAHYLGLGKCPNEQKFIDAAGDRYGCDGEIEIDSNAVVSSSEIGAYVMAWVWVDNWQIGIDPEDGPE